MFLRFEGNCAQRVRSKGPNGSCYLLSWCYEAFAVTCLFAGQNIVKKELGTSCTIMFHLIDQRLLYDLTWHFDYQPFPAFTWFGSVRFLFVRKVTFGHEKKTLSRH